MPVSSPGPHSSMPAGHPEGPLVLKPTELAILTFVLSRKLEGNRHNTCPRWPQNQWATLQSSEGRQSRKQTGIFSVYPKKSIPGSPSTKFCWHLLYMPQGSMPCNLFTPSTAPPQRTDQEYKNSGQAGIWKRSPKKAWLFKILYRKNNLWRETRFQTLAWLSASYTALDKLFNLPASVSSPVKWELWSSFEERIY